MNTTTISRREELCRSLNMNFDEASELFCDETLQSMQMAKVNGGGFWASLGLFFANPVVGGVCAVVTVGFLVYEFCIESDTTQPPSGFSTGPDGRLRYDNRVVDSVKFYTPNNVQIWTQPTPTPTVQPPYAPNPTK